MCLDFGHEKFNEKEDFLIFTRICSYLIFLTIIPIACFVATTTLNLPVLRFGVVYFLTSSFVSLPIIFIFNDPSWFQIVLFTFVSLFQLFAAMQMKELQSIIA